MAGSTRKSEIEMLKTELADMGQRLMELTGESLEDLEDTASTFADNAQSIVREKLMDSQKIGKKVADKSQEYAEENPWQMLAAGVAIGVALAFFLKRNRD
jgi:ElaB/YqjD/DUF883 family membrane-anchored ribosome-binding protein